MKNIISAAVLAFVATSLYGNGDCQAHGHHDHEHHNHADEHGSAAAISVHLAQKDAVNAGIRTAKAERRSLGEKSSYHGRFELTPTSSVVVPSIVGGKLDLKVSSLQTVKKGDLLFTVFSPEVLSRKKELEILSRRLEVYRKINTPNAELENLLEVKRTELESLLCGAPETDGMIKVFSPADGLVDEMFKLNGSWVNVGEGVVKITDMHKMRFKALIPADEAAQLHDAMEASVSGNEGVLKLAPGGENGLVPAYVLFKGKVRAVAGQRAVAQISLHDHGHEHDGHAMMVVPRKAVVEINLKKYVFVKDRKHHDKYIAYPVRVLDSNANFVAIDKLPYEDCQIVVDGAYELKLASSEKKNTAGHFHADGTFHEGDEH